MDYSLGRTYHWAVNWTWRVRKINSDIFTIERYGEVCIAEWKRTHVAVKKLFYKSMSDKDYEEFKMECHILSSLQHPNILQMLGACIEVPNLAIVTEYMPLGNLQDLLYDKKNAIPWKVRLQIAQDVSKGVAYLHSMKPCIIHR
jgi:serine/threonine protein kinase